MHINASFESILEKTFVLWNTKVFQNRKICSFDKNNSFSFFFNNSFSFLWIIRVVRLRSFCFSQKQSPFLTVLFIWLQFLNSLTWPGLWNLVTTEIISYLHHFYLIKCKQRKNPQTDIKYLNWGLCFLASVWLYLTRNLNLLNPSNHMLMNIFSFRYFFKFNKI